MPVIAMTREMGSLGKDVALGLEAKLGLEVIHHELVEGHVANRMHVQPSSVHRFLESSPRLLERWGLDQRSLSLYTEDEILEIAAKGNVLIRGWGATRLLRTVQHAVCVRVCAPLEMRVDVLTERLGLSDREIARREIRVNDTAHTRAMQGRFEGDWRDPLLYDLVLNTAHVPVDECVELIAHLAQSAPYRESDESRAVLNKLLLKARIRSALHSDERTRDVGQGFELLLIDVEDSVVSLTGIVGSPNSRAAVEAVVTSVDGVKEVRNSLGVRDPGDNA